MNLAMNSIGGLPMATRDALSTTASFTVTQ